MTAGTKTSPNSEKIREVIDEMFAESEPAEGPAPEEIEAAQAVQQAAQVQAQTEARAKSAPRVARVRA